jgi:TRAP-type C4-dicarboxylate transport system permease small subunit
MSKFIANIPKIVVGLLLVAAIVNLLIGVFLRYVMVEVTDWLDVDPIRFTWVEEVGEMMLAWLTLIGAAIGIRERSHFALNVLTHRFSARTQAMIGHGRHVLIVIMGAISAWYGVKLCLLNRTLATPGLEINLAVLYASVVVGGALMVVYAISMIVAPPPRSRLRSLKVARACCCFSSG